MENSLSASSISTSFGKGFSETYTNSKMLIELNYSASSDATLVKSKTYRGKYFDGSSVTVSKGYANTSLGSKLSVIARFKIQSFPSDYMEIVANTEGAGFDIYVNNDKKIYFDVLTENNSSYTTLTSSAISTNTWYTVVGTYDGSTLKLYLNGSLVASTSVSGAIKTSVTPIVIGADPGVSGGVSNLFKGIISDVIVIKDSISQSLISSNYSSNVTYSTNSNTIIRESW